MSVNEPLPCPFCGGRPSTQFGFNILGNYKGRVICGCGAEMRQGRNDTEDDVVGRWNRRERVEELESLVRDMWPLVLLEFPHVPSVVGELIEMRDGLSEHMAELGIDVEGGGR